MNLRSLESELTKKLAALSFADRAILIFKAIKDKKSLNEALGEKVKLQKQIAKLRGEIAMAKANAKKK